MDDGEVIERCVELGILPPLTKATFESERDGLREDILNWNHQHAMVSVLDEALKEHQHH